MIDLVQSLEDGPVKDWYNKFTEPILWDALAQKIKNDSYTLDKKSGLLIRKHSIETMMDIIFPRPVDLHHHEDVNETLYIQHGSGVLYKRENEILKQQPLLEGYKIWIPVGVSHTFGPKHGDYLEIALVCSGILDPNKEVCEKSFDDFQPWLLYYTPYLNRKK